MSLYQDLVEKKASLAVIGLGYVGLPIALAFAKKVKVIGFDIAEDRIKMMQRGEDPSNELDREAFEGADITFTSDPKVLGEAQFHVVAVPTPVDEHKVPDLTPVLSASRSLGAILKKGDYVVYESTVYPGCTEEDCLPILEELSGLKLNEDFKLGYSPERINPGDKVHTLQNVIKVVSGSDDESLDIIAKVYELVVDVGVHRAPSIKVAEAAKIIENTQRDLNIALMNELSKIFDKVGVNTYDVIEAAGTKWNFLKFKPGLVGGHCIGVDPYYLTYKSMELGYEPEIILSGRRVNDGMARYVAKRCLQMVIARGKNILESKVLVMGATFKENVTDIRNSKIADLVDELSSFSLKVEVHDPYASSEELKEEYGFGLIPEIGDNYDAFIVAVNHDEYATYDEAWFKERASGDAVFIDVKGFYNGKINELAYWSL